MKKLIILLATIFTSLLTSCNIEHKEEVKEEKNISQLLDVKPTDSFIDPTKDTLISGEEGTLIYIPKNSLVLENGEAPKGNVQIELKEYYQKDKIMTQPLTTVTKDGELLKSGGMIDLKAFAGGQELKLKKGKEVLVHFPKTNKNDKMNLFSGVRDKNQQVVWKKEKTQKAKLVDNIVHWYTKLPNIDEQMLYQENGNNIYDWINANLKLTPSEKKYFLYKDINVHFTVTSTGEIVNPHFKKRIRTKIKKRILKIMESAPKCKPYTVKGKPVNNDCHFNLGVTVIPPSYANDKSYLKELKSKAIKNGDKSLNTLSKLELHYFIFNSNKLGLMNCDAFVNDPAPKCKISIEVKNPTNDVVKFAFKEYKSFVAGQYENGKYHFNNIPKGKEVTLMVLKYKNNKAKVGFKEIITDDMELNAIPLSEMTLDQLQVELKKLN